MSYGVSRERDQLLAENDALAQRNAELAEAVQARDQLLSVIGHELRNPISPIFMSVRALLLEARSAPGGQVDAVWLMRRLERMESHTKRFLTVLDRILDLSQLSSGRLQLVYEDVDLAELVADVVTRFQAEAAAAHCGLSIEQLDALSGSWDRVRLEQIVSNLLSNAIRYGAGAPIVVKLIATARAAVIQVRDGGIGIAPEDQTRIFEHFERAKPRLAQGGFGVGLWVVKTLCEAFGGTVAVESALDQGATFTVSLPRTARVGS